MHNLLLEVCAPKHQSNYYTLNSPVVVSVQNLFSTTLAPTVYRGRASSDSCRGCSRRAVVVVVLVAVLVAQTETPRKPYDSPKKPGSSTVVTSTRSRRRGVGGGSMSIIDLVASIACGNNDWISARVDYAW